MVAIRTRATRAPGEVAQPAAISSTAAEPLRVAPDLGSRPQVAETLPMPAAMVARQGRNCGWSFRSGSGVSPRGSKFMDLASVKSSRAWWTSRSVEFGAQLVGGLERIRVIDLKKISILVFFLF
ncbi:hypothetical protein PR202_gb19427 [Eleusine coracana subsp. coracana]|uniref:Uncharacterized protein n=1 Tax=Eleusine coracana subsp. coracana TaxID=191504 RepID=A0AAV5F8U0_ELECO|nr:hypothetical protein PR202_gb19427 [Eleusine coracana subsp. coracana]